MKENVTIMKNADRQTLQIRLQVVQYIKNKVGGPYIILHQYNGNSCIKNILFVKKNLCTRNLCLDDFKKHLRTFFVDF